MRKFRELNADTKQRISQALKGRGLTDNHKQEGVSIDTPSLRTFEVAP